MNNQMGNPPKPARNNTVIIIVVVVVLLCCCCVAVAGGYYLWQNGDTLLGNPTPGALLTHLRSLA